MRVLILSAYPETLRPAIEAAGDTATATADRVSADDLARDGIEFLVSYGYRHLVRRYVAGGRVAHDAITLANGVFGRSATR